MKELPSFHVSSQLGLHFSLSEYFSIKFHLLLRPPLSSPAPGVVWSAVLGTVFPDLHSLPSPRPRRLLSWTAAETDS